MRPQLTSPVNIYPSTHPSKSPSIETRQQSSALPSADLAHHQIDAILVRYKHQSDPRNQLGGSVALTGGSRCADQLVHAEPSSIRYTLDSAPLGQRDRKEIYDLASARRALTVASGISACTVVPRTDRSHQPAGNILPRNYQLDSLQLLAHPTSARRRPGKVRCAQCNVSYENLAEISPQGRMANLLPQRYRLVSGIE